MKLLKGNRVKLVTHRYGESKDNPIWGGLYGKISGTIIHEGLNPQVRWDNKKKNSYVDGDLELIMGEWDE